ncbi:hypothetical protein A9977_16040 [Variovorax sp. UMC13]|nr:hypothetical protein [Variovorax sp. UMC13]
MATVAATLRAETMRGAIRCALWINETETLDDRIDLVIAEIEQGLFPQGEQRAMTCRTLRSMRKLLAFADSKGDIYDTLWLADRAPCKLLEYLDLNIELLEQQRGQRPADQGVGGRA